MSDCDCNKLTFDGKCNRMAGHRGKCEVRPAPPSGEWMQDLANELISDPKPTTYDAVLRIIARHAAHRDQLREQQ